MMATPKALYYLKRINAPDGSYAIIPFKREEMVIGRAADATFAIANGLISRKHAVFTRSGDRWSVTNFSMNGVFINEVSVPNNEKREIEVGNILQFGMPAMFVYRFAIKYPKGNSSQGSITKIVKKVKTDDKGDCDSQVSLRDEHASLEKKLRDSDLLQARLQEERNSLQASLHQQKHKLERQYQLEKEEVEKQFSAGTLAQQALLQEKEVLAKRLETQVIELQSRLDDEHKSLAEKLRNEEQQKRKLIQEKEEVILKLEEMTDLEKKMQEERLQLQEQLAATENQRKELEKEVESKESLIKAKEMEQIKADQLAQEKQQVEEELSKVKLALQEKEDQYTKIDSELKTKDLEMQNKIMSMESGVQERVMAEVEKTSKQLEEIQSEKIRLEKELKQAQVMDKDLLTSLQNALNSVEAQKEQLEAELACTALASDNARKEVIESVSDVLENEFQCPICNELFITAMMLGCSHTFCKYCIDQWKKNKMECPNCRARIASETRSLVVDNFIEKIVSTLSDELKTRRKEMVAERSKEMAAQAAAVAAQAAATANRRGRRGQRSQRGRGRGGGRNGPPPRQHNYTPETYYINLPDLVLTRSSGHVPGPTLGPASGPAPGPASGTAPGPASGTAPGPAPPAPVITIPPLNTNEAVIVSSGSNSSSTDTSIHSDSSSVSGEEDVYYGGYGRCYNCGRRGHWAHGCPDRW